MAKKDKISGKSSDKAGSKGPNRKKPSPAETPGLLTNRLSLVARGARTRLGQHLLDHGLYAGQDSVIMELAGNDGLSPGAIAESLGVRAPTVTKTINRLAAQGFVEKRGSEADGRKATIYLTAQGHDTVEAIRQAVRETEAAMLDGLSAKEAKTLAKLLKRIDRNLQSAAASQR